MLESRLRRARVLFTVIVVAVLVIQVYPLLWILLSSLRPAHDFAAANPFSLPTQITLDNFQRAFQLGNIPRYLLNSLIVTAGSVLAIVVLGITVSYAIGILSFRYGNAVLSVFLSGIVVPVQVVLIPLFILYRSLGILNTYWALILPMAAFALPISVYLFVSFFRFIPREVIEASIMDGCNPYTLFFRIVLPMSTNTIVTVVFVNSIFIWNDFMFANTFIFDPKLRTVPLGLQDYIGAMGATDWTATFAAVATTVTPVLLVFLAMNRAVVQGLEAGAVKG